MTPEESLDMLYSATRNLHVPADVHDQLRSAYVTLKAFVAEKIKNSSEKKEEDPNEK